MKSPTENPNPGVAMASGNVGRSLGDLKRRVQNVEEVDQTTPTKIRQMVMCPPHVVLCKLQLSPRSSGLGLACVAPRLGLALGNRQ